MTRATFFYWIAVLSLLAGCKPTAAAPETQGAASPEAVALSLSTVDPEESLHLFDFDRQAPLDIQETRRWHEDGERSMGICELLKSNFSIPEGLQLGFSSPNELKYDIKNPEVKI